jgi:hypothetical protein
MASELDKLAEELKKKHGLDLADVLRDTHAETAMRVASIISETLGIALRWKLLAENKPVNDQIFKNGSLKTLEKRIDAAHDAKLIDAVAREDAHLVRRIRNNFGHTRGRLDFESNETVALAKRLSTYQAATSNQEAFLKAAGNVSEQVAKAVNALRQEPAQA